MSYKGKSKSSGVDNPNQGGFYTLFDDAITDDGKTTRQVMKSIRRLDSERGSAQEIAEFAVWFYNEYLIAQAKAKQAADAKASKDASKQQ